MSNKSIIATLLIVGGAILHLVVVWSGLNIDPENSEHVAQAIGMALPGIFMAAIAGLVVGLIVHLFSKERTRSKFFLVFSIFFLATILMIAYGMSENRKSLGLVNVVYAQTTYTDSIDHYSFTLPEGWEEIPTDVIEQFTGEVARQTGGQQIEYDAGFQLSTREYFQYPYVLVQEYAISSPSYNEIEGMIESGGLERDIDRTTEEYSELLQNSSVDKPFVDKERGIIFMTADVGVTNVGAIKGLFAIVLGKEHTTRLFFYSLEEEYTQWLPVFESMINSFSYEEAYAYDPVEAADNDSPSVFEGAAEQGFSGAIIGGLLGLIVGLIAWGLRRKKKQE